MLEVILLAISIPLGSLLSLKGFHSIFNEYIIYHFKKYKYIKNLKKSILNKDFIMVQKYFYKIKSFDTRYNSSLYVYYKNLFNITDDILNDKVLFNKFYKIINKDISEEDILEYCKEHSLSLSKNESVLDL